MRYSEDDETNYNTSNVTRKNHFLFSEQNSYSNTDNILITMTISHSKNRNDSQMRANANKQTANKNHGIGDFQSTSRATSAKKWNSKNNSINDENRRVRYQNSERTPPEMVWEREVHDHHANMHH